MGPGERGLKRLIVTADDFGASANVNDAIEKAHLDGILTTASLMVAAPEAADAAARAKRLPGLRVGLHVVAVRGRPMLPAVEIPDLVDAAGVAEMFDEVMDRSSSLYEALVGEYPHQAAYAVSMAYRIRYNMQFNAREAMHMLELRSSPQGHPSYRRVALEMHRLIAEKAGHHAVASAMTHMTQEAPELERLESERRAEARRNAGS